MKSQQLIENYMIPTPESLFLQFEQYQLANQNSHSQDEYEPDLRFRKDKVLSHYRDCANALRMGNIIGAAGLQELLLRYYDQFSQKVNVRGHAAAYYYFTLNNLSNFGSYLGSSASQDDAIKFIWQPEDKQFIKSDSVVFYLALSCNYYLPKKDIYRDVIAVFNDYVGKQGWLFQQLDKTGVSLETVLPLLSEQSILFLRSETKQFNEQFPAMISSEIINIIGEYTNGKSLTTLNNFLTKKQTVLLSSSCQVSQSEKKKTPLHTPLCDLLKIEYPIMQAPIGSATCPALVSAVSQSGGIGTLAATWISLTDFEQSLKEILQLTNKTFAINFVLCQISLENLNKKIDLALANGVKVFSFAWGEPQTYRKQIEKIHRAGGIVLHTVGSENDVKSVIDAGIDVIIAQGSEAGGHVMGKTSIMMLLPKVINTIKECKAAILVMAAGGVGDGKVLAGMLNLGAVGVSCGSAFLVSDESLASEGYKNAIINAKSGSDTVMTRVFQDDWNRDAPQRVIINRTIEMCIEKKVDLLAAPSDDLPGKNDVVAVTDTGEKIKRYTDRIPLKNMQGVGKSDVTELALYAGKSIVYIHEKKPAAKIMMTLVSEAIKKLAAQNTLVSQNQYAFNFEDVNRDAFIRKGPTEVSTKKMENKR